MFRVVGKILWDINMLIRDNTRVTSTFISNGTSTSESQVRVRVQITACFVLTGVVLALVQLVLTQVSRVAWSTETGHVTGSVLTPCPVVAGGSSTGGGEVAEHSSAP